MKYTKTIGIDSLVRRAEYIDAADLNGEKVMMNLDKGRYFALNEVGSRIWDMMDRPLTVRDIVDAMTREYEIDEQSCAKEVLAFLGKMYDEELISVG